MRSTIAKAKVIRRLIMKRAAQKKAATNGYMNNTRLAYFLKKLEDWRKHLMFEAERTMQAMQSSTKSFPDEAERASQEEMLGIELRTRDRERKLIHKIEHTIDRIKRQQYGYCLGCGDEIGILRLKARPTADLCIECKTTEEIKEKHLN